MSGRRWLRALFGAARPKRRTGAVPLRLEQLEERLTPSRWVPDQLGPNEGGITEDLRGVWGSGPDDVFAVGYAVNAPFILHSGDDGASWQAQNPGTTQEFQSVWGSGPDDVFAVGSTILHSSNDGASWAAQTSGTQESLTAVWGNGPDDVFAVGPSGVILHSTNDGASWQTETSGTTATLYGVWGAAPQQTSSPWAPAV